MRRVIFTLSVLATLWVTAVSAQAAQRYASAASNSGGGCALATPCSLESAIEGAADNDDVIVLPGTYTVNSQIELTARVNLYGQPGQASPILVGSVSHSLPTLTISS